ncbi:DHA2 family efflux MFS transporter permease subunit [Pseudonocardia spinosispora]|uniref:DHA2 family efflux MFS transporter permease subunit n=1 Tax=Pseudonocardia spinosispora TaxID=103441 RepID=UPI00040E2D52|nr:DHA2 family efflux MFS transporter permease subunit [Pseudonocardia spinosispora]
MTKQLPVWLAPLLVLIVGNFVSVLDVSIVNIAIPDMEKDFGVSTEDIQWITTAYSLTLGVLVPASGWLGDRIGLRKIYLLSLVMFGVTSTLCGLAWDLQTMIVFRILQAIPGGVLPVVVLTMLYQLVPPREIGTAMGIYGLGVVFAPAAGPSIGGWLVENLDWRWIFFINAPVCITGTITAAIVLREFPIAPRRSFDFWGFVTIAAGLFVLLLALTKGPDWGWTSYPVLILITGGVLSLALFVVIELELSEPLLDVRLFLVWPFTNSLILLVTLFVGLFAVLFYIPQFLQAGQNVLPFDAGLILLPEALVMAVLTPVSGILYDKIGPRWPTTIGLLIAAYGAYLMAGITPDTPHSQIILWTCVRATGNGLAMMCIFAAGLAILPPHLVSNGGAINNVAQRVASALGLALIVALETNTRAQLTADRSELAGQHHTFPAQLDTHSLTQLYRMWRQLRLEALTDAYGNVFLVTAIATALGALSGIWLKIPKADQNAGAGERPTADGEPGEPVQPDRKSIAGMMH